MQNASKKTALVTGANKGIGFEVVRQLGKAGFTVFLGARNADVAAAMIVRPPRLMLIRRPRQTAATLAFDEPTDLLEGHRDPLRAVVSQKLAQRVVLGHAGIE